MFATTCPRCGARIELHPAHPRSSTGLSRFGSCALSRDQVNAVIASMDAVGDRPTAATNAGDHANSTEWRIMGLTGRLIGGMRLA